MFAAFSHGRRNGAERGRFHHASGSRRDKRAAAAVMMPPAAAMACDAVNRNAAWHYRIARRRCERKSDASPAGKSTISVKRDAFLGISVILMGGANRHRSPRRGRCRNDRRAAAIKEDKSAISIIALRILPLIYSTMPGLLTPVACYCSPADAISPAVRQNLRRWPCTSTRLALVSFS